MYYAFPASKGYNAVSNLFGSMVSLGGDLEMALWLVCASLHCGEAGTLYMQSPPVVLLCTLYKRKVGLITQLQSSFCLLLVADSALLFSHCNISFELNCKAGDGLLDCF